MLNSLPTTGKNLLRSAEHFSLLMIHTTASSVGGFLSSLPPPYRAGNWNAFIALLIYNSSSLHYKEGRLFLAYEQSTMISELLLQRASRKKDVWCEQEQKTSHPPNFFWRLLGKQASTVFFFLLWHNQTTQKTFSEIGILQSHKACLGEEWRVAISERGRRGPQSRNTWYSRYLVPVLQFIKTKEVQLSIFQGIVIKKKINQKN